MWLPGKRRWRKSSLSYYNGNCVEVADLDGNLRNRHGAAVRMRDSKDLQAGEVWFHPDNWDRFIEDVRQGKYDRRSR